MSDMISQFNLDKISKSGAKFDIEKLQFFNSMHIRMKFQYSTPDELQQAILLWREMLIQEMP